MNVRELAEKMGSDVEDLMELLDIFLDVAHSDLKKLQEATERGIALEVAESAHSIKGAASHFGFMRIYEQAKTMEANARGGILDGNPEAAGIIQEMLDRVKTTLEEYRQQAVR
jgi:HPt (histidine-containing phosphotransfer) domain-containing protein